MRWPGEPRPRYGGLQVREDDCSYVWEIPAAGRCDWLRQTPDCEVDSFVPYPTLLFCTFGTEDSLLFAAGLTLLFLWLLYLFLILGTTADNFFCPSLATIASVLRLSENIAGVTILAFGNGSPDIFTSLVSGADEQLIMFTELIGAGVFVTAIIAGSVVVCAPFRIQPKYFIRDACFYIFSVFWICFVIYDEVVHLWEACERLPAMQDPDVLRAFVENRRGADLGQPPRLPERSRAFDIGAKLDVAISREMNHTRSKPILIDQATSYENKRKRMGLFREFFYDANPVNAQEWQEAGCLVRCLILLRAPFMLVLQLSVPVVNETAAKRGWSKLLNCSQLAFTPVLALCLLEQWSVKIGPVPLLAGCFGCTSVIALLILLITSKDKIPKYHNVLAFVGFLAAMLVVYAVAQEVMAVLECVGFASGISDAMLGITLLAWGNSVGDLISNVTIARKGFPRMGFAACFGGPMFNTLLGLGLSLGISAARSEGLRVSIRTSDMAPGCLAFLLCSLVSSLIYLVITGFVARRSYGYLLFTIYAVFMLINILSELHVIHPLGTDHRPDELDW